MKEELAKTADNSSFEAALNTAKSEISKRDNEIAELKKALAEREQKIAILTTDNAVKAKIIAEKNAQAAEAVVEPQTEPEIEPEAAQTAEEEPQKPTYDISNLGDPNDKSSPAFKIAMYDKISSGLGDLMISANRDADAILQKAKDEAAHIIEQADNECSQKVKECDAAVSKIKSETEEEAAYIRERLSEAANELLKAVSADLHTNIDNCMREIETGISGMQYEVNTLMQKIEGRNSEMSDRIDYYRNCVTDGITKKLSDMDEKYGIEHDKN